MVIRILLFFAGIGTGLAFLMVVACEATPQPNKPVMGHVEVVDAYQWLRGEQGKNPDRFWTMVQQERPMTFTMRISKIEGRIVKDQRVVRRQARDSHVVCVFEDPSQVFHLNVGQTIKVSGKLFEAFEQKRFLLDRVSVYFKNCRLAK